MTTTTGQRCPKRVLPRFQLSDVVSPYRAASKTHVFCGKAVCISKNVRTKLMLFLESKEFEI